MRVGDNSKDMNIICTRRDRESMPYLLIYECYYYHSIEVEVEVLFVPVAEVVSVLLLVGVVQLRVDTRV